MALSAYLPSTQFIVIVGSVVLSGGLVVAAQQITKPASAAPSSLAAGTPANTVPTGDWLANLRAIEGQDVGAAATTSPTLGALLEGARSSNLTDTVARTLFINLSEAKSQGLGSDIPTQEKLIEDAAAQIRRDRSAPAYTSDDITISSNTAASFKSYGNQVITTINLHPKANFVDTAYAVGLSIDNNSKKDLAALAETQAEYRARAKDLAHIKVPPTLVPLHLQAVNNFANMAGVMDDLQAILDDSLRGFAGFQFYQALNDETERVFINIAQELSRNGILFNKDEAGSAWSSFLSSQ